MRITQVDSELLRLPLPRPITTGEDPHGSIDHVFLLIASVDTDAGHRGVGFAWGLHGGRALKATLSDDLTPLVMGEDPLDHERLLATVARRLYSIGRSGLVTQAYSAIDMALWDLKGKAAGLPLYKLLGGAREASPAYGAELWLWMSADEILEAAQAYIDQGLVGVKLKVGNPNPEIDAEKVTRVREALGEDVWLAVDANQRYDFGTALSMGHFFEEEIGADWFEEPIACDDVEGHARLVEKLEIPIALGESLYTLGEFHSYLQRGCVGVVQPDVTHVGGLTAWLKVAALADCFHKPMAPHLMPEVAVHLACGLPQVHMVEYLPWFAPAFVETPAIVDGQIVPPKRPGLGLEVREEALVKYRVEP
ncbi:MAG TPA: mandelate racemase/muconate lactonizing enzyme family protein [Gemmataceae bacterium]|jgi:L-alanine-DL-glutamate epimerase-like enolase superfamily enzyme|nr:mandelate racemase/muconate lactonizing enzyme family protein [Gemmataceae bacterium]